MLLGALFALLEVSFMMFIVQASLTIIIYDLNMFIVQASLTIIIYDLNMFIVQTTKGHFPLLIATT
jgi:hypothetical protein